jgi:S-adenosylmethionine hydrolase
MPVVTLTTDFGLTDTYVGVMKGVILRIAPEAHIVDLTHDIAPHNVLEAAIRLQGAARYFQDGTVHLVVVDPGVGTDRAAVVVKTARHWFVAPDNGVLTAALRETRAVRAARLGGRAAALYLQPVSATFHGRDVFAPIAAHLAAGLPFERIAAPEDEIEPGRLVRLSIPDPEVESGREGIRIRLTALLADRFGNVVTNLTRACWDERAETAGQESLARIDAGGRSWRGIRRTFADVAPGEPVAYWGSAGRLEIAIRNGSASETLRLAAGSPVDLSVEIDSTGEIS